jgi:hypothetical protein
MSKKVNVVTIALNGGLYNANEKTAKGQMSRLSKDKLGKGKLAEDNYMCEENVAKELFRLLADNEGSKYHEAATKLLQNWAGVSTGADEPCEAKAKFNAFKAAKALIEIQQLIGDVETDPKLLTILAIIADCDDSNE